MVELLMGTRLSKEQRAMLADITASSRGILRVVQGATVAPNPLQAAPAVSLDAASESATLISDTIRNPPTIRPTKVLSVEIISAASAALEKNLRKRGHVVQRRAVGTHYRAQHDVVIIDTAEAESERAVRAYRTAENIVGRGEARLILLLRKGHTLSTEKLKAIGVDEVLIRPIGAASLYAAVESADTRAAPEATAKEMVALEHTEPSALPSQVAGQVSGIVTLDREAIMSELDGDKELLGEIATLWLEQSPEIALRLSAALTTGDLSQAMKAAATIRSSLGYFRDSESIRVAAELEARVAIGDVSGAREVVAMLDSKLEQLRGAVRSLASG